MSCDNYIKFSGNRCPDAFIVNASLTANTVYRSEFKGKFNNKIIVENTTDEDGQLTIGIDGDDLRKDFFHPFSGAWQMKLFLISNDGPNQVIFCNMYEFIELNFEDVQPVEDPNYYKISIQCQDN